MGHPVHRKHIQDGVSGHFPGEPLYDANKDEFRVGSTWPRACCDQNDLLFREQKWNLFMFTMNLIGAAKISSAAVESGSTNMQTYFVCIDHYIVQY